MKNFKTEKDGKPIISFQLKEGRYPLGVLYLHGWLSCKNTPKAAAIAEAARQCSCYYAALDYRSHGQSEGKPEEFTVGAAFQDVENVLTYLPDIPLVVVGNSIGGWIGFLLASKYPERIVGYIGLAPAVDIIEDVWLHLVPDIAKEALNRGDIIGPSPETQGFCLTKELFEDGKRNALLKKGINYFGPVRILWGDKDNRVPFSRILETKEALKSQDVQLTLIKGSDHHLSEASDLMLIQGTVKTMLLRRLSKNAISK